MIGTKPLAMTATAATLACLPIIATPVRNAAHLALGYASAGFWTFVNVYQGFTNFLQIPWTVISTIGSFGVGYYAGRTKHGLSIPASIARGLMYAPLGGWMTYGLAPAVMPLACAGLILYLKGDMKITLSADGTLETFETEGIAT